MPRGNDPDVDQRRLRRSAALAGVGDGIAGVALPLLATRLTRDPLAIAGVVAAQQAPWAVMALLGPLTVGRVDRRTSVGLVDSVRAVAVAYLGVRVLAGTDTISLVQLAAAVVGLGQVVTDDGERAATVVLVPGPGAVSATSRAAVWGMVGLAVVGLPAGGVLYELFAPASVLAVVFPYALAALFVLGVRHPVTGEAGDRAPRPRLAGGTLPVVATTVLSAGATGAVLGVLVLFALDDLGLGAPAFGLLLAALALAAAVGAALAPAAGRLLGLRPALALALLATAGGHVATSVLADPVRPEPAALALGVATGSAMMAGVLLRGLLHLSAGRVVEGPGLAAFHTAAWAAVPVGALVGGAVAREVGVADLIAWTAPATVLAALTVTTIRLAPSDATNRLTPAAAPWSDALVLGNDQREGV